MRRKASERNTKTEGSRRERAYQYIQQQIAARVLRAGTAVSELTIAKELGVSRTPIREAMNQLVAEGLLTQTPNRGAVVVQLARQDIEDLYELREALEVFAAGKATRQRPRSSDIAQLRSFAAEILVLRDELTAASASTLNSSQMARFIACDLSFHTLLMSMAANARILKVVNETRLLIRIFAIRRLGHSIRELEQIHAQHAAIVESMVSGNDQDVMRLLSVHIRASRDERIEAFLEWERGESLRLSQYKSHRFSEFLSMETPS